MVRVRDKSEQKHLNFPKTSSKNAGSYTLTLKSETNQCYVFDNLEDESELPNYYKFSIDFSSVKDGEYKYTVMGEVEDYGVIRIGGVTSQKKQNNSEKERIIQYE